MRLPEEGENMGITGEVTIASLPLRPPAWVGLSVEVGSISEEVAGFFEEFDKRTPNPHPERYFWEFKGPLVPFGDFWVPDDCVPYLQRLTTKHGNFITNFKLSAGLGGPMLSLLGSVLAAMSRSNLGTVTKAQILTWKSVIQDLMEVGFDLRFFIGYLWQTA
jgi:hypothetical protein